MQKKIFEIPPHHLNLLGFACLVVAENIPPKKWCNGALPWQKSSKKTWKKNNTSTMWFKVANFYPPNGRSPTTLERVTQRSQKMGPFLPDSFKIVFPRPVLIWNYMFLLGGEFSDECPCPGNGHIKCAHFFRRHIVVSIRCISIQNNSECLQAKHLSLLLL